MALFALKLLLVAVVLALLFAAAPRLWRIHNLINHYRRLARRIEGASK